MPRVPPFIPAREAPEVGRLMQEWVQSLSRAVPILDGRLIEDVELLGTGVDVQVSHGLGRKYRGWFLVGANSATADYPADYTAASDKERFLTLRGDVQTVNIWVF